MNFSFSTSLKKELVTALQENDRLLEVIAEEKEKRELAEIRLKDIPRWTRIPVFEKADPQYIEAIAKLLEDDRFKFFLEDTMHDLVEVIQKIQPGDSESVDKRTRAALRMDGIQFLINKLAEIRGAYFQQMVQAKGGQ